MGDEKEALDFTYPIPPEGVSDAVAHRMYGKNLWPRALHGFRPAIESYLDEMIRLGLIRLLAAMPSARVATTTSA